MTVYANFTYYQNQFLGTAISETDFPALALKASAVIDILTSNRAASDTVNTAAIANATCAVAEELQRQASSNNIDGIASETLGRHSITYSRTSSQARTNLEKQSDAALVWLASTGLMFLGFYDGEYSAN